MISIALCDDDVSITDYIREYLEEKASRLYDISFSIATFTSGEDFLCAVEQGEVFNIVFMDIQMEALSGIEAGRTLRGLPDGDDTIMIFISSHNSFFEELVQLGSFRFIKKPIDEKELDDVFGRALRQAVRHSEVSTAPSLFQFSIFSDLITVRTNEIAYLKNTRRKITLFSLDSADNSVISKGTFYSTIDSALQQLPKTEFVQCERSHVVNLGIVLQMDKDAFILIDDKSTKIPIGKVFKQDAKKAYFRYLEGSC